MREVYNFSAGPAMLPEPVMRQIQSEFLDFANTGSSIIEISHRSSEFKAVAAKAEQLMREHIQQLRQSMFRRLVRY